MLAGLVTLGATFIKPSAPVHALEASAMTTVQITLPDQLAHEAAQAGLLAPEKMATMLREQLRHDRLKALKAARATLAAEPLAAMTAEEVSAEINAYRTEQRRATGS
jgi:hypothetical protein